MAAFDVNADKVGKDVADAIYAAPQQHHRVRPRPHHRRPVQKGPRLDGVHKYTPELVPAPVDVVAALKATGAEIVVDCPPVGSTLATEFYANAAIEAGCGFVNCIPVFIASNDAWAQKFADAGLPVVGTASRHRSARPSCTGP